MGNAGGVAEGEVLTYVHLVFDEPQVVMANGLWARTGSAIDARLLGGLPAPKASKRSRFRRWRPNRNF
ncbi:MAG: hypothetical protein R3D84_06885 [Paracoccaceae bacterium]